MLQAVQKGLRTGLISSIVDIDSTEKCLWLNQSPGSVPGDRSEACLIFKQRVTSL